jgi:tetratricopeptide (TPR) repeat protein
MQSCATDKNNSVISIKVHGWPREPICASDRPFVRWIAPALTWEMIGLFLILLFPSTLVAAEPKSAAHAALRAGDYAKARELFGSALKAAPDHEPSQLGLLQALRETGAYREAGTLADSFLQKQAHSAALRLERARMALLGGQYAMAERLLRECLSMTPGGPFDLRAAAQCLLGDLLDSTGRKNEARGQWQELVRDLRSGRLTSKQTRGNAAVAAWRLGYAQDARDLFLDATDEKTNGEVALDALCSFGFLFLDKYSVRDALGVFRDCLKINKSYAEALLGIALAKKYESSAEVEDFARAALKVNPNLVPAMNLLAELRLQEENYDEARKQLRQALGINPLGLESLSLEAAYYLLQGNDADFIQAEKRILDINPNYGRLYYTLAESMVTRRKYREAVGWARKALTLDPLLWPAHTSLGMNLMRLGELNAGRIALQQAFEGDPFNIWAFNTLDLLDQMAKFSRKESEHFIILMSAEDAPNLSIPIRELAEEVYGKLTRRYAFTPKGPLQIEVFPDHEGFAVRTLGLPGLGALGVCFGQVVAVDSPRARKLGSFNWGATLWHEFAHVITLQMTHHNIPRWYSEGISVYEERKARTGWGESLTAAFVRAFKEGKLLKPSELNAGIMRPKFPEQIDLSYFQASLVCELIEERFGFEKIRRSLELLAVNPSLERALQQAIGWDFTTLDKEYAIFLESRLRRLASRLDFKQIAREAGEPAMRPDRKAIQEILSKNPDDFFANLRMGTILHEEKNDADAEKYLLIAERLFPEFVEPGNPYELLGMIYLEQKREQEALGQFLAWTRYDASNLVPLVQAAEIYGNRKNYGEAAKMYELSIYVQPYDQRIYSQLGEAASAAGNWEGAVEAYQILLGLNPTDPAEAHYNLAHALWERGSKSEAKREVLRALEIAPTFAKAQDLLLKLSGSGP